MNISSIGHQTKPYISPQNQSNDTVDSLQRQRERLVKQLEYIKSRPKNSQAEQDAAVAQKQALEKQIAVIDQKIQKGSQSKDGDTSGASSSTMQNLDSTSASDLSVSKSKNQIYLNIQHTGRLLDTYS